jgi:hypothetical protein
MIKLVNIINLQTFNKSMSTNSYLQLILTCFSSLDIAGLRLHLKDDYPYQATTKEIFLNEIEEIFKAHKHSGDTELLMYEGRCVGTNCDNCGMKGYRFVGNNSKNYMELLFEVAAGDIIDIIDCPHFKPEVEIQGLGTKADIYFDSDDRVTFHKTPEYLEKVFSATNAYSELVTDPPKLINFKEIGNWLDKHSELNARIGSYEMFGPTFKWTPFSRLYDDLQVFKSYISDHLNELVQANISFNEIVSEQNLIDCVLKYESIYDEASSDLQYSFKKVGENYILNERDLILFSGEEFFQTLNFVEFYKIHYWELLSKYTTYTEDEISKLFNNSDSQTDTSDILSLKFHLEKRKELEKLGINIPFDINKTNDESDPPF